MANYVSYSDATELMTAIANKINNSGFITNTVNNLLNYYLKTETYSKAEVDSIVNAIRKLDIQAVAQLPTTNISTTTIYLVPKQDPQVPDVKDEYINLDGTTSGWELIGNTQIDLSNYVTTSDLTTALQSYATKAYVDGLIGDLSSATTTDKSSVVAMVNEVNGKIAFPTVSSGNPADIKGLNAQVSKSNNYAIITLLTSSSSSDVDKTTIEWDGNNDVVRFRNYINNTKVKETTFMSSDKKQAAVSKVDTYASGASWGITKQLNLCVLRLINIKDLPNGRTLVGTMPEGYRPQNEFYEYVYSANTDTHIGFIFATNGEITAINNTGSTISGEIYANRDVAYFTA